MSDKPNEVYTDLETETKVAPYHDKDSKIPDAIKTLSLALNSDPDYYLTWQANIASQFAQEFERVSEERGVELAVADINGIAERAARRFLNLLIK